MKNSFVIQTLIVFAVAVSLASLPGTMSSPLLPMVHLVRANPAPATSWLPAGPSTNAEIQSIFSSDISEQTALLAETTDLSDVALTPNMIACLSQTSTTCSQIAGVNPSHFAVTSPLATHEVYEIQFLETNNYWNIPFNFGLDSTCSITGSGALGTTGYSPGIGVSDATCPGVSLRQAFAHMVDKSSFCANNGIVRCNAVDNDVPPSDGLITADPCGWDALFPQTGANCHVGAPGGTAYHLGSITGVGHDTGGVAASFAWEPATDNGGMADLCAAAAHISIGLTGAAANFNPATCVLTLTPAQLASAQSHPVNIFARSDRLALLHLGDGLMETTCYLFTGHFSDPTCQQIPTSTTACVGACVVTETRGPLSLFPGFTTSKTAIVNDWWVFTGESAGAFPFDRVLYAQHNSQFVSGGFAAVNPPCSSLTGSTSAVNYQYTCVPAYDTVSRAMESSPCISVAGDPSPAQSVETGPAVSFANCVSPANLSAVSAGYQAEDVYGKLEFWVPIYAPIEQFGYLAKWNSVINSQGASIPNLFTWLDASSTTTTTITQGFATSTRSVNPYAASTVSDLQTIDQVYDSLGQVNPSNDGQQFDWLTSGHLTLCNGLSGIACTPANLNLNNVFAQDPTTNPGTSTWTNPQNGFHQDLVYATSNAYGQQAQYGGYGISLTGDPQAVITKVEIGISGHRPSGTSTDTVLVEYTVNGGATWNTAGTFMPTNASPPDNNPFFDVTSQQTWTSSLLTNTNLEVRITHTHPAGPRHLVTISVNWVPVRVSFLTNPIPSEINAAFHFQLRPDIFWQSDSVGTAHPARQLTSWDVKFSYLTLKAAGAFQSASLSPLIDVRLWKVQSIGGTLSIVEDSLSFDLYLNSLGPFTLSSLTTPTIIPGRYWSATCSGATWDSDVTARVVPSSCMAVTTAMSSIRFDPISSLPDNGQSSGILIGSGPFECQSTSGVVGSGCSSTGAENPPGGGFYTMTRFGCNRFTGTCNAPGANPTATYFRSAGTLASAIWAGNNGDSSHDSENVSIVGFCFEKAVGTAGCGQFQRGIGNPGCTPYPGCIVVASQVNVGQVSAVNRFAQDGNWVSPFNWLPGIPLACCPFTSNPPDFIQSATPVLIEGTAVLNPCIVDPANGYDC